MEVAKSYSLVSTSMGIDETKRHRESEFGPPSEIICPNEFAGEASAKLKEITKDLGILWNKTKKQTRDHVKAELRCVLYNENCFI